MKIGILGIAHMHVNSYVDILKKQGVKIVGVYDHNEVAGNNFCQQEGLEFYPSLEELLNLDFDAVLICSENVYHKELSLKACSAKKHILVEKPMALNSKDCLEMIVAAKKENVQLMVAHPVRFSKPVRDLKKIVDKKMLGCVISINTSNHGKNPGGWFINPVLSGGGALIDHTVHILDTINYLFGLSPKYVSAFYKKSDPSLQVEDSGLVGISFSDGVILSLDTSWNRPKSYPVWGDAVLEVVFEKGYVIIDGFGRKMKFFDNQSMEISEVFYEEDMDSLMIDGFIEAIKNNTAVPVTGEDGLYTVKIAETALKSATQQRTIPIN
ncbi:Gfo/Idh/MocA family oxidoreductase [Ligilactobacillus sp. WILCCON 0076]|uniref:Gfo/Idh/MocA family oxidoreductase n=1 Tax=Ligilactobacillus ubinensis TaxID=2876789 RepID=A0A9X2FFV0_9LACO|nr:Gfo/Idh/MocA family oxidoreductase [Ligilactobacillus ubinensis]MCP0885772.1 Gfo/Idh/MocA family oxidoreductase [Ligilactobacillus ubinensis]